MKFFLKKQAQIIIFCLIACTMSYCTDSPQRVSGNFETDKNELSSRIDARIESLNNDLERLRENANDAGENVSSDFRVQLTELEAERERLQAQKEKVENATEEEWEETRNEISQNLEEIERTVDQEVDRLEKGLEE